VVGYYRAAMWVSDEDAWRRKQKLTQMVGQQASIEPLCEFAHQKLRQQQVRGLRGRIAKTRWSVESRGGSAGVQ
jgi:hypothetical protein